ncbi:MAG TPA: DUF559 domain-containing protein [Solirubrobacteraceae bacterium]|nr:DUF559 domain-containing protein [Solirubrobacteraceae bacterium]
MALGKDAVLSHLSAACLWRLVTHPGDVVHATNPTKRAPLPGVIAHRSDTLTRKDLRIHHGLPVTSPARTLLDSAPLLSDRQLERAFDQALVEGTVRRNEMVELLARARGHHGWGLLAGLADREHGPALTKSEAEERARQLIHAAGLPQPLINTRLHGYELDFYWPDHQVVLEVDGFPFHTTRRRFERDHRKDSDLKDHGLDVVRVTARQVNDEPFAIVAMTARALGRNR